jgi:hypothetical protein
MCCAKIPFSFEVDGYDGQTGKPNANLYICIYAGCFLAGDLRGGLGDWLGGKL